MSTTSFKSDTEQIPVTIKSSERIRQRVDDRHWQLFETRLKNPLRESNHENYTKSNDYRIIDRLKKVDQPQVPIEPNHRWETFCSQLTNRSNETDRLMSIFHHVWIKNWNTKQTYEIPRQQQLSDSVFTENTFLTNLSTTEHDRKIISSILHQKF